jgi:aminoglycoside 3-N-acetyltransferase
VDHDSVTHVTGARLARDLRALGLTAGDLVMVHASLRAIGPVIGGPDEVHHAIVDVLSPGGAMMMLVGCAVGYDDIGRGTLTASEEAALAAHLPPFRADRARAARELGALAELFRSFPGTLCSANVGARMAARGDRAAWLVADHPMNYGYGAGSPMAKLVEHGGRVLLLGSDPDQVTLLHYAEHVAPFEGKRVVRFRTPLLVDGRRELHAFEEFDTGDAGVHAAWPDAFFAAIVNTFIAANRGSEGCRVGKVGGAESVLIDAASLVAAAIQRMVERAGAPW